MTSPDASIPDPIAENTNQELREELNYLREQNGELESKIQDLTMENREMQEVLEKHIVILERVGTSPEEVINMKLQIDQLQEQIKQYEKDDVIRLLDSKQGESSEEDIGESVDFTDGAFTR